ncbi:MAG: polyheme membrane-associated cytochrome C, partial [Acidobacteria bacterium]|nr:polyheme membrane-associated cytochrome C [Acidobacteriota bacterium]
PYWFIDTNGNGKIDTGENTRTNAYQFNARMLKAAYNFQVSKKDPAGFVHNSRYIAQLLVDSIEIMGGDISAYTWR